MIDAHKMLYVFVFTAKRMVKGAATLTSFALAGRKKARTIIAILLAFEA